MNYQRYKPLRRSRLIRACTPNRKQGPQCLNNGGGDLGRLVGSQLFGSNSIVLANQCVYAWNLSQSKIQKMGIPRFYRWLKGRYPLIRFDMADSGKQRPSFDNLYIDFNALVYQCIRESGCFLKNKVKPLTEQQIIERVIEYLLQLVRVANPKKLLYIALDGVAPRAKINQSRDRRFKSGVEDIQFFDDLAEKIGISTQQIFQANSISPGTAFLFTLCERLRGKIMELMGTEWRELIVMYSDCCAPGEGEHKIMDFLRYSKANELFNKNTTHCVYSPDADVILLTLAMNLDYICIIKEDTSQLPAMAWTATSTFRKFGPPQFELVMINILREYFEREYAEVLQRVKSCTVQKIINDLVLLMAFVGNDFLPNEFCFVLKDSHLDALFKQYRQYLLEHEEYINNQGTIDWANVSKLLKLAKSFEANMISEMKAQRKNRQSSHGSGDGTVFDQKERGEDPSEQYDSELEKFEVQDNKIVQGIQNYYASRFNIQDRLRSKQFEQIIVKYIEGLEFYCQYYYKGLPSWTWYYPFHYTPLLCDVDDYISRSNVKVELKKDEPFDPILALMFMFPQQNFGLLPKPIADRLLDPKSIVRSPVDYYPRKFELDRFQTLKYNKHALIPFLKESDVRKVYESVPKEAYSKQEIERNIRRNSIIYYQTKDSFTGMEVAFNERFKQDLKKIIRPKYDGKQKESNQRRFPTLYIYGQNFKINEKGCIVPEYKYKHNGNPTELVFYNNFIGYVQRVERAPVEVKSEIQDSYVRAGIFGNCENYFVIKRGQYVREVERFHVALTNREVVVPDFALFKAPNYDYIQKTKKFENKELYKPKERVVVLAQKYFGCIGIVQQVGDKNVKVRLVSDPIRTQEKIEEFDEEFYKLEYVMNELEISKDTLMTILSEVILLPRMGKKKDFNERLPSSLNFGLNFIDVNAMKIVPRFVRCNFAHQNTKNPQYIFDYLQISKTGLSVLHKYVSEFHWLIEAIEESRSSKLRKQFKASTIFAKEKDPNIKLYQQFVKLYELDTKGPFQSIYSRIASHTIPALYTEKKGAASVVTLAYHEIFSRTQALIAPPAYKSEPEYHDIGSRVILLRTLEVGYVVGIDDQWIHVMLGKEKRRSRVRFTDLYNESWENNLSKELGKGWNLEVSYYTPTYWKPAISK